MRYSADMFINMLKTKLNGFLQNGFKYRKISQLFEEFPRKSETNAFKSFICRRENVTAVRSFASQMTWLTDRRLVIYSMVLIKQAIQIY